MLGNLTEIPASKAQKKMFYIELLLFLLFSESTFQKTQYKINTQRKTSKRLKQPLYKRRYTNGKTHVKRGSTLLIIKEMQMKTTEKGITHLAL